MEQELKPCERCNHKPVFGGINYHDKEGCPKRDEAIYCLHCSYWFYTGKGREETARRWNTRSADDEARALLEALAAAEKEYRFRHDLHGDDDMQTGRAWDQMRRAGDIARAYLTRTAQGGE